MIESQVISFSNFPSPSPQSALFIISLPTFISLPMVCHNICERIYSKIEVTPIWQAKNIAEDVSVTDYQ